MVNARIRIAFGSPAYVGAASCRIGTMRASITPLTSNMTPMMDYIAKKMFVHRPVKILSSGKLVRDLPSECLTRRGGWCGLSQRKARLGGVRRRGERERVGQKWKVSFGRTYETSNRHFLSLANTNSLHGTVRNAENSMSWEENFNFSFNTAPTNEKALCLVNGQTRTLRGCFCLCCRKSV